jgi:hypothetical protein
VDDPAVLQHKIEIGQYVIEQLQSANAAMQAVVQYGMAEGATDDGLAEAHDAVREITDLLTRAEASLRTAAPGSGAGSPCPPAYLAPICQRTASRCGSASSAAASSSTTAVPWNMAPWSSGNRSLRSTRIVQPGVRRRFTIFWPRQ